MKRSYQLQRDYEAIGAIQLSTHDPNMDIRKFFGTGATSVTNIAVTGKFTPLGRSQIRSQRGRSPPPRSTRGRKFPKSPVAPPVQKPGRVHGLVRGGRKNPMGTFWVNKAGVVGVGGRNKFEGVGSRDYCPTASFIGWDGSSIKMQCGCDSGESTAATIIQKYARRMIVLNTTEIPDDPCFVSTQECAKCGGGDESSDEESESSDEESLVFRETNGLNDEEWDEESLVRETYGRHTYNFADTRGVRLH